MYRTGLALALALLALALLGLAAQAEPSRPGNVAQPVWQATEGGGETSFLVILRQQADLSRAQHIVDRTARGRFVAGELQETAARSQAGLRALLWQRGALYRPFYIVNALLVSGGRELVIELASRPEVDRIVANPTVQAPLPQPGPLAGRAGAGLEWNVERVNADDVWNLGYTGQGVVVAGQDTGYNWDHPALLGAYRGWNGVTVTHDYNWHDAIHEDHPYTPSGNPCGFDAPAPCDDHGHGTHTMGTIVGDDGAGNQIGVAPGARWIGCRNMEQGRGTPASYIECFEFFLAPYPVGGDFTEGDPARAPHVINNSWVCPDTEGCPSDLLRQTVEAVRAAGILVVASAGNEGPGCSTVLWPPATYEAAFSVGATDSADNIASFSSRGPVDAGGTIRREPDVSAPGVSVRSSLPGGYGSLSGTSMAAPHVAGVAALLWSAAPERIGDVDGTEQIIQQTARPRTTSQGCGSDGADEVPNNVYGWGIVDALAAVQQAPPSLALSKKAEFSPGLSPGVLRYTLVATNTSALTLTGVVLTDTIPPNTLLAWASQSYTRSEETVSWEAATLGPGHSLTRTLAVTVSHLLRGDTVVNSLYGARGNELPASVMGAPVSSTIPWRILLLPVFRAWNGD